MKAIIIGSGLAGLTTAAYLAKEGVEVNIFEQYSEIGGVAATIHQDDFSWDLGPLLLAGFGPNEECTRVLTELNINEKITRICDDRGLSTPDFEFWAPEKYEGIFWRKRLLKSLFPKDSIGLDKYYTNYFRTFKLIRLLNQMGEFTGIKKYFLKCKFLFSAIPFRKMLKWNSNQYLDFFFTDIKIKGLYSGILADFVVKPSEYAGIGLPLVNEETAFDKRIPINPKKGVFQHQFNYIKDGCGELVGILKDYIEKNGGKIYCNQKVEKILIKDKIVNGILLDDGNEHYSDIVISSITAKVTFEELIPSTQFSEEWNMKVRNLKLMESVFMVHLGVDFDPTPFQRKALCYYYQTYDIEKAVDRIRKGDYHEGKDGFLIYIPSMHSPHMAPDGMHAITLYTVAPNVLSNDTWDGKKEYYADILIALAEKYIPGLKEHVISSLIMTPLDFQKRILVNTHSFGGSAPIMGNEGIPYVTPMKNLWYCGCQSESAGGIEGVMKGARKVSTLIKKAKKLGS